MLTVISRAFQYWLYMCVRKYANMYVYTMISYTRCGNRCNITCLINVVLYLTLGSIDGQVTTEPLHTPITILHLLTHTSGISYGIFGNNFSDEMLKSKVPNEDWKNWYRYTPLTELCEHIASTPLCFQPGKHFLYGLNFEVLGRVVEVVSGCTLDVFLYENIFKPLDMRNTGFSIRDKARLPPCYEVDPRRASYKLCEREELFSQRDAILLSGGGEYELHLHILTHSIHTYNQTFTVSQYNSNV